MNPLLATYKLHIISQVALQSVEVREAYLKAQARALEDVKDMPRNLARVNAFTLRWLEYFQEEYIGDVEDLEP
jgi:hypothetical protein